MSASGSTLPFPSANRSDSQIESVASSVPTKEVFFAWLISRLFITFFAYIGHATHPFREKIPGAWEGVSSWWLNVWTTYDSQHFLDVAAHSYTPTTSVFFPLYPFVLRLFGTDYNTMALWGIIVSNVSCLGALWLFYDLTQRDYGTPVARRALWLLAFFPSAAFSMAVYTESFYLFFSVAMFWCVRRYNWLGTGVFGILASLSRNTGPIFTLALIAEWIMQRKRGKNPPWWGMFIALVPMLVFIGLQLYFRSRFGSNLPSVSNQSAYHRALTFPLVPIWLDFVEFVSGRQTEIVTFLNWLASVMTFVLVWLGRRKVPPADAILMCGVMLMQLTVAHIMPPFTNSSLRYSFLSWPFTQLVALQLVPVTNNRFRRVIVAIAVVLLLALHSYEFGQKSYLG